MKPKKKTKQALWVGMKGGINPRTRLLTKPEMETVLTILITGKKPRKRIRVVSKSRAKELRKYSAEAKAWKIGRPCACSGILIENLDGTVTPICQVKTHVCEDVHHRNGRVGALLLDQRFWTPVCRKAHTYLQEHPDQARKLGLLCQRGQWNVPVPPDIESLAKSNAKRALDKTAEDITKKTLKRFSEVEAAIINGDHV